MKKWRHIFTRHAANASDPDALIEGCNTHDSGLTGHQCKVSQGKLLMTHRAENLLRRKKDREAARA